MFKHCRKEMLVNWIKTLTQQFLLQTVYFQCFIMDDLKYVQNEIA